MNILDPMPLASIHVTILSIFFAVVVAYLLFIYSTTEQMILQAIQKIEDDYDCLGFVFYAGGSVTGSNTDPEALARQFRNLVHISGKDKWQEALHTLSILSRIYPFSEKMKIKPDGGILITNPEPIPLVSSLSEAREWVDTMKRVEKQLDFLFFIPYDRQRFQEILDAYYDSQRSQDERFREYWKGVAEEQREDFSKYLKNHPELDEQRAELTDRVRETSGSFEAVGQQITIRKRESADEIYSRFSSVFQIANNVLLNLNRMDNYKKSHSMKKLRYFFIFAGAIFLIGFVLPMALHIYIPCQNHLVIKIVMQICSFWIPVILYTIAFFYVKSFIFRE